MFASECVASLGFYELQAGGEEGEEDCEEEGEDGCVEEGCEWVVVGHCWAIVCWFGLAWFDSNMYYCLKRLSMELFI